MHPKSPMWLDDIATRCGSVIKYSAGRSQPEYDDDRLLRSAVERNFEMISLALLRLERTDPVTAGRLRDYRRITDMHDRLVRCVAIDGQQVWPIIQESLPVLKTEVEALLREAERSDREDAT